MTKTEQYIALREAGHTFQEIADMYGCSRQNVAAFVSKQNKTIFRGITREQVVFDGLRDWMNKNKVSVRELYRQMHGGKNAVGNSAEHFSKKLRRKHDFRMGDIDTIIAITGLNYETLFLTEASNG